MTLDLSSLIPLTIHEFKLFAPTRVNGVDTMAYLDTGANHTTLSPEMAEDLPRAGSLTIGSAFNQVSVETVENVRIDFLGETYTADACVNQISASVLPFDAGITLGAPTIYDRPVVFDFRLLGIMPYHGSLDTLADDGWTPVPVRFMDDRGLCFVELTGPNGPVSALFDTGAGVSAFNALHTEELGIELGTAYTLAVGDATGTQNEQQIASCSGLRLGALDLPPFDCFAVDLSPVEKVLGYRIDLVLGANALLKCGWRWLLAREAEVGGVA